MSNRTRRVRVARVNGTEHTPLGGVRSVVNGPLGLRRSSSPRNDEESVLATEGCLNRYDAKHRIVAMRSIATQMIRTWSVIAPGSVLDLL